MADRKLQYIIEILPKLGKFDDIKQKLEDGVKLSPKEVQLLKGQLGEAFKGASQEAMTLGKEIKKAVSADGIDTSTLVNAVKMIAGAAKELEDSGNPIESWGKIGSSIVKPLSDLETRLDRIDNDLNKLKRSSSVLEELRTTVEGLKTSFASISNGTGGSTLVSEVGSIATISTKIDEATQKSYDKAIKLQNKLKEIANTKVSFTSGQELLKELHKYMSEYSDIEKKFDDGQIKNMVKAADPAYHIRNILQFAKNNSNKLDLTGIPFNLDDSIDDLMINYQDGISDAQKYIELAINKYNKAISNVGQDTSPNVLVNQLKDVKLSLRVPPKSEIVNKINNVLKTITTEDLEPVKINISDVGNVIEDRTKRAYGDKPEVEDANTEALVEKTGSRLERVAGIIEEKQGKILDNTKTWRKEMIEAMSIAAKDLEFQFGWDKKVDAAAGELFDSIQDFFNLPEHRLNLIIDEDGLKSQLKNIIGDNNLIVGGGGTATIDPNAMVDIMKSIFYGTPMPTFDTTGTSDASEEMSEVDNKLEDVTDSSKQYVKELDATSTNVQKVIEALRKFAKYATKSNASKGSKDIASLLTNYNAKFDENGKIISGGINIDEIAKMPEGELSPENMSKIIKMVNDALMSKDETGRATGRTLSDELSTLMDNFKMRPKKNGDFKGAGKVVENLRRNIAELFTSNGIETELNQIAEDRMARISIFRGDKGVEKAGRTLATLNTIRPYNRDMANFSIKKIPSIENIAKVIDYFKANKWDTTALDKYMEARKTLGDKTDEQSVAEFKVAVEEFRKSTSPLYNKLQGKWGDFKGQVSVEGRKHPIAIKNANDVLKIPDDAKITDVIISDDPYKTLKTDAYVDENGKYNFRADKKQQRMNSRRDERPSYISKIEQKKDILNEPIVYKPFKPLESSDVNFNYEETNRNKEDQIKHNEESVKAINKKIEDLNKALKEQEQKASESRSLQDKIGKLPLYTNTIDNKTTEKLDSIVRDKQYKIKKVRNTISKKQDFNNILESQWPKEVVDAINKRDEARKNLSKVINDSSLIEKLTVEEAQERIKRFENTFKNSETSDDLMYYYEKFLSNPKETLALLNDKNIKDERIKRIQGNAGKLKQLTTKDVQELFDQGNTQRYYYKLYQDFINNPNGVRVSLQQAIDNATSDVLKQDGYLIKWAKSEEDKLPEAEKILQSSVDKLITKFRTRAKGMYQKAIDLQGQLLNGNLTDEDKLVLTSQLQDTLNELKSIMSEYDNFSKGYNTNNKTLFGKDKTKSIGKLNSQYLSFSVRDEVNANVRETTGQLSSTRAELMNLENKKKNLQIDSQHAQNLIKRTKLQQQYDDLQEKSLNLTTEITQIEEEDPANSSLVSKRKELEKINTSLEQIKANANSLGGLLVGTPEEISDNAKQQYARRQAKEYQAKLHMAEVQQRIAQSRIDDITRQEESIKKQGLGGAGVGAVALNKTKRNLISEFMNSDYVRTAETVLRDKAKAKIAIDNAKSTRIYNDKVSEAMTKMGWNPQDKTQLKKFLNTDRGKQWSQEFEKRQKETEDQIWSQYDKYVKDLREQLLIEFKKGLTPDKQGIVKPTFLKPSNNYNELQPKAQALRNEIYRLEEEKSPSPLLPDKLKELKEIEKMLWVDDTRSVSIKNTLLSQLADEKEILEKKLNGEDGKSGINATIDDLKQQRDRAMAYGGIDYSDIRNDKYLTDIEVFTQRIEEKSKELVEAQNDLALLEEGGASKQSLNAQKKKIATIQEEIAWNEQLIENRETLIEQKEQERIDSKATPEERRIFATKQLTKLQENLVAQDERITQYKADADAAKGTEKEVSALAKYNEALAYREKLENRIKGKEEYLGKLNTYISNKATGSSTVDNGEISSASGGIVGAIVNGVKESIENIGLDKEGLATEETLSAIRDLLGGGSSNSGLTAEEKARMTELEAKGAGGLGRNISIDDRASDYGQNPSDEQIKREVEELANYLKILRDAIGKFDGRSSARAQADFYNTLDDDVREAGYWVDQSKDILNGSDLKLLQKFNKLKNNWNKYSIEMNEDNDSSDVKTSVGQPTDDDELDSEVLSKILERIDNISNRISSLEDGPEKEALINEYKELSKLIPNNDNYGRTPEEEAELQSLRARNINTDGTNTSTGIVGIMQNELAKESTLSQVLNKLGEIAKRNAMSGKPNSAQDLLEQFRRMLESDVWEGKERAAYIDLNTGSMSNTITGNNKSISAERLNILRSAYKDVMDLNAQVHTHANEEDPYFSAEDFKQFGTDFANGITKQILLSKDNMTVLDMTDVKNVDGLLQALAKTEQNFEALAATADKFGAKYVSKSFSDITSQGLVKMLGIKGIESKLSETETRESARAGVAEEDAKEVAKMLQESTGRAIKTTVQRVGVELETLTEKTDTKGNKTWSSEISNKYQKAMEATNKRIVDQGLGDVFGKGTDAAKTLTEYEMHYSKLLDLVTRFKSASKEEREGLQAEINALLPTFDQAEKKLVSLITRKDKFIGDDEVVTTFSGTQLKNTRRNLEAEARKRYGGKLNPGSNVAFGGYKRGQGSGQLYVDVLKDGTIKQYVLEVDKATGQVKEYVAAENALANAFQNVNKAMKQNEYVLADVAIGDGPKKQAEWMANASSPQLDAYKKAFEEMQNYTAQLWNSSKSPTQQQLDYLMQLSERVIVLGRDLQKTSGEFKNFWAQNPDSVVGIDFHTGDNVRSAMERYAQTNASASSSKYNFVSFDNNTLKYKLTDVEGNVRNVTMVWDEMYQKVAMVSDKSVSALDPLVAKVEALKNKFADAAEVGYLDSEDGGLEAFNTQIEKINDTVKNGGTFEELEEMRKKAIALGDVVNKTISRNKRMPGVNEIGAVERQRTNMKATFGDDFFDRDDIGAIKEYNNAYKQLIADFERYKKEGTLYNAKNQDALRVQATKLKENGKTLSKSLLEAQKLEELVENSGTYQGKQVGGIWQLSAEETNNLEASMRSYLKTLGLSGVQNIKFNNTNDTLTASLRTSNKTVSDLEMKYNDVTGALYLYQKQERESLTGWPAFIKGFKGKIGSILQYTASITSIYRVFNTLRQGITYIKEIDSALTELKKVTDETEETYDKFLNTAAKTADKVGSTIKDVVSSTADWARLNI